MTKSGGDAKADRAQMRDTGRQWAYELQQTREAAGEPFGWFEDLYTRAEGEAGFIPWEMAAPRFKLSEWLVDNPGEGGSAVDIGCGLGDNARLLAEAGYDVTAFDISATAVAWAAERQKGAKINFVEGDLFAPPKAWVRGFTLVHETYNLQAMPRDRLDGAIHAVANLVAPGGRLLLLARSIPKDGSEPPPGPPWPLSDAELAVLLRRACVKWSESISSTNAIRPSPTSNW